MAEPVIGYSMAYPIWAIAVIALAVIVKFVVSQLLVAFRP